MRRWITGASCCALVAASCVFELAEPATTDGGASSSSTGQGGASSSTSSGVAPGASTAESSGTVVATTSASSAGGDGGQGDGGCGAAAKSCDGACAPLDDPAFGCAREGCAPCPSENGEASCEGGACIITCDEGRLDADADVETGCELAVDFPTQGLALWFSANDGVDVQGNQEVGVVQRWRDLSGKGVTATNNVPGDLPRLVEVGGNRFVSFNGEGAGTEEVLELEPFRADFSEGMTVALLAISEPPVVDGGGGGGGGEALNTLPTLLEIGYTATERSPARAFFFARHNVNYTFIFGIPGANQTLVTQKGAFPPGQLRFLVGVYGAGSVDLHVDGALDATHTPEDGVDAPLGDRTFDASFIGRNGGGGEQPFFGRIAEILVYEGRLSPDQLFALHEVFVP